MSNSDEANPYELLEVGTESTEQEIRTAYRQRSLKVHPDRNRNNPDAARKFHELNQAYELLLDPLRRLALDAKLRLKAARDRQLGKYDKKRKVMIEELEERERLFKKAKDDRQKEELNLWKDIEKIKDEGRRLVEEREKEVSRREQEKEREAHVKEQEIPSLGTFDTTVRLKYTIATHPSLVTPASLSTLLSSFGAIDTSSIVLSMKPPKKAPDQPPKNATALVPFKQIGDAHAAVCASGRAERGLEGVDVSWAEGKEPPILGWLRSIGKFEGTGKSVARSASLPSNGQAQKAHLPQTQTREDTSSFSSFPEIVPDVPTFVPGDLPIDSHVDYESLTLMRLRQAERERVEREIRESELGD